MDHPMPIVIYAFLQILLAVLYSCIELPHRKCSCSDESAAQGSSGYYANTVRCHDVDLDISNNFNVNLIPEDAQELDLSCPLSMPFGYDDNDYCNTLRQSCTPVPFRPRLSAVQLRGFQADHGRLPLAKFFENISMKLNRLYIHSSKIGSLDADFLRGLQNLTLLHLRGNDLEILDINAFQSLIPPSGQVTASPTKPKLKEIVLDQYKLQQLDWSVFRPLADCLETINIEKQRPGLRTILRSGPSFNLSTIKDVTFRHNKLTTLPTEILQTIAIYPYFEISVEDNNMCSNEDCPCSEVQEFMGWGRNYLAAAQRMIEGDVGVRIKFKCGGMYVRISGPQFMDDRNCTQGCYD